MNRNLFAVVIAGVAMIGQAQAGSITDSQCRDINRAFVALTELNVLTQRAALKFQKESIVLMMDLYSHDEKSKDMFVEFQQKITESLSEATIDGKVLARGVRAVLKACPKD